MTTGTPVRPAAGRGLLIAYGVVATANLAAQLGGWALLGRLTVWVAVPLLTVWAWIRSPRPRPRPVLLLVAGTVFGWGGDVALSLPGDLAFLLGMVSFLVQQVLYVLAFRAVPGPGLVRAWPVAAVPYVLMWLGLNGLIWDGVGDLRLPVLVYSTAVIGMALAALDLVLRVPRRPGRRVALGGLLFVLSDALIALREFGAIIPDGRASSFAIMMTYLSAQALIVTGLVSAVAGPDSGVSRPSRSAARSARPPTPPSRPPAG